MMWIANKIYMRVDEVDAVRVSERQVIVKGRRKNVETSWEYYSDTREEAKAKLLEWKDKDIAETLKKIKSLEQRLMEMAEEKRKIEAL